MRRIASPLAWLVTACVPLALIGATLRIILLPVYLPIEYAMPGFPRDDYGFSTADRLRWAGLTWDYLTNTEDASFLADLRFAVGSAVFNEREVSHMQDVKVVVQGAFVAWYIALAVLALIGIAAWRSRQLSAYQRGLRRGGWLTIALAALIGIIVAVGMVADPGVFWAFFTFFHGLFFTGDSWLFAYSDTLIRLFPIRFWQDTFLIAALIVLGGGLALAVGMQQRSPEAIAKS